MSGYSEARDCPRCDSKESLEVSVDDIDVSGTCLECGYCFHTLHEVIPLSGVNEERKEFDMEPLTELKKPTGSWKDEVELTKAEQMKLPSGREISTVNLGYAAELLAEKNFSLQDISEAQEELGQILSSDSYRLGGTESLFTDPDIDRIIEIVAPVATEISHALVQVMSGFKPRLNTMIEAEVKKDK